MKFDTLGHLANNNVDRIAPVKLDPSNDDAELKRLGRLGIEINEVSDTISFDPRRTKFVGMKFGPIEEIYLAVGEVEFVLVRDVEKAPEGYLWAELS